MPVRLSPIPTAWTAADWALMSLSVELKPLRSTNDVAALLRAMQQFPAGLPRRAELVAAATCQKGVLVTDEQMAELLDRLDTHGGEFVRVSAEMPDEGREVPCTSSSRLCSVFQAWVAGRPQARWPGPPTDGANRRIGRRPATRRAARESVHWLRRAALDVVCGRVAAAFQWGNRSRTPDAPA